MVAPPESNMIHAFEIGGCTYFHDFVMSIQWTPPVARKNDKIHLLKSMHKESGRSLKYIYIYACGLGLNVQSSTAHLNVEGFQQYGINFFE